MTFQDLRYSPIKLNPIQFELKALSSLLTAFCWFKFHSLKPESYFPICWLIWMWRQSLTYLTKNQYKITSNKHAIWKSVLWLMKQARGSDELLFMHRLTIAFFSCKNIWYIGYFAPKTLHRLLDYASYSKLLPVEHTVLYTNFLVTSSNNLFLIIQPVQQTKEIYFSVITPEWCY